MNTGAVRLFVPSVYDGDAGCHLFTAAGKRANDDILSTFYNFSLASKLQLLVPLQLFVCFFSLLRYELIHFIKNRLFVLPALVSFF